MNKTKTELYLIKLALQIIVASFDVFMFFLQVLVQSFQLLCSLTRLLWGFHFIACEFQGMQKTKHTCEELSGQASAICTLMEEWCVLDASKKKLSCLTWEC